MPIPALVNALQALGAAFSVGHASSAAGGAVAATGAAKDAGVATAAATSSTVSSATGGVKVRNTGVSVPPPPSRLRTRLSPRTAPSGCKFRKRAQSKRCRHAGREQRRVDRGEGVLRDPPTASRRGRLTDSVVAPRCPFCFEGVGFRGGHNRRRQTCGVHYDQRDWTRDDKRRGNRNNNTGHSREQRDGQGRCADRFMKR